MEVGRIKDEDSDTGGERGWGRERRGEMRGRRVEDG